MGEPTGVHLILATNREALANVLMALGKRDNARKYLDQADNELEAIRTAGREVGRGGYLADKLSCLADSYGRLGETGRAAELKERASRMHRAVVHRAAVAVADAPPAPATTIDAPAALSRMMTHPLTHDPVEESGIPRLEHSPQTCDTLPVRTR